MAITIMAWLTTAFETKVHAHREWGQIRNIVNRMLSVILQELGGAGRVVWLLADRLLTAPSRLPAISELSGHCNALHLHLPKRLSGSLAIGEAGKDVVLKCHRHDGTLKHTKAL